MEKKRAVICGDYLLSLALKLAASIPQRNEFKALDMPNYLCRICMGELRQEINNGNLDLSVYRYLSIIKGKTAALFEASFHGGAMLSTKDEKKLRMYRKAGNDVGMIFQLMDDCIDYEMEEAEAKKNVRSDYEEGVVTLPLIHAMNQDESFSGQVKKRPCFRQGALFQGFRSRWNRLYKGRSRQILYKSNKHHRESGINRSKKGPDHDRGG